MESTSLRLPALAGRERRDSEITDCQFLENATCICNTQGKYDKIISPKKMIIQKSITWTVTEQTFREAKVRVQAPTLMRSGSHPE